MQSGRLPIRIGRNSRGSFSPGTLQSRGRSRYPIRLGLHSAFSTVTRAPHGYSGQFVANGGSCNSRPAALSRFVEVQRLQLLQGAVQKPLSTPPVGPSTPVCKL